HGQPARSSVEAQMSVDGYVVAEFAPSVNNVDEHERTSYFVEAGQYRCLTGVFGEKLQRRSGQFDEGVGVGDQRGYATQLCANRIPSRLRVLANVTDV